MRKPAPMPDEEEGETKMASIKSYGFANAVTGHEAGRGWQGSEDQAIAHAQALANQRGEAYSYWEEGDESGRNGEGEPAETLVTIEPAETLVTIEPES